MRSQWTNAKKPANRSSHSDADPSDTIDTTDTATWLGPTGEKVFSAPRPFI